MPLPNPFLLHTTLAQRLLAAAVAVLLLGSVAFLQLSTTNDLRGMRGELHAQRDSQLRVLLPAISAHAVAGEREQIRQALEAHLQRHPQTAWLAWIDARGDSVHAGRAVSEPLAPDWFRLWAALSEPEGMQAIESGGRKHGHLVIRIAADDELNAGWERFQRLFELVLSICGTLIAALLYIATRSQQLPREGARTSAPSGAGRADLA